MKTGGTSALCLRDIMPKASTFTVDSVDWFSWLGPDLEASVFAAAYFLLSAFTSSAQVQDDWGGWVDWTNWAVLTTMPIPSLPILFEYSAESSDTSTHWVPSCTGASKSSSWSSVIWSDIAACKEGKDDDLDLNDSVKKPVTNGCVGFGTCSWDWDRVLFFPIFSAVTGLAFAIPLTGFGWFMLAAIYCIISQCKWRCHLATINCSR